jgi:hypothetical protein
MNERRTRCAISRFVEELMPRLFRDASVSDKSGTRNATWWDPTAVFIRQGGRRGPRRWLDDLSLGPCGLKRTRTRSPDLVGDPRTECPAQNARIVADRPATPMR